jgi:hypothetical protein
VIKLNIPISSSLFVVALFIERVIDRFFLFFCFYLFLCSILHTFITTMKIVAVHCLVYHNCGWCDNFCGECIILYSFYKPFCRTCLLYSTRRCAPRALKNACDKMVSYKTRIINYYFAHHLHQLGIIFFQNYNNRPT